MTQNRVEKLRVLYKNAEAFLHEIVPEELQGDEIEKYFTLPKSEQTKASILYSLLLSLQNGKNPTNVIGLYNENRAPVFKEILFDYDANAILKAYNADTLLECFKERFDIKNIESKRNLWVAYAKSIISACEFIIRFDSAESFDKFVMRFTFNELSAAALPMLLEKEIYGMGFPLACDFLTDLGYTRYPISDNYIKELFSTFNLCDNSDYAAFKTVVEMATATKETPYKVNKIFWLIGSGNFHLHNITVEHSKEQFTQKMKSILQ